MNENLLLQGDHPEHFCFSIGNSDVILNKGSIIWLVGSKHNRPHEFSPLSFK